jgi:hypothetical protein
VKLSVCPSILLNNKECSPLGVNEGVNFTPRGQISPLGVKFTPRGEIHPWGPGVKLRMALSSCSSSKGFISTKYIEIVYIYPNLRLKMKLIKFTILYEYGLYSEMLTA